jgi:hypothetical protein
MRLASCKNISASLVGLTSLVRREKCYILWTCESRNLQDSQTSKIKIHSEKLVFDPKFSQDFCKTPELKLVMILAISLQNFCLRDSQVSLQKFSARFTRSESCYKISFCETCKKQFFYKFRSKTHFSRFSLRNFCLQFLREASLATNFDSQLSRESYQNYGSKKASLASHENLIKWFSFQP